MMRAHAETEAAEPAAAQGADWAPEPGTDAGELRGELRGERRDAVDHHQAIRAVRERLTGAVTEPAFDDDPDDIFATEPEPEPTPEAAFAADPTDPEAAAEGEFCDLLAESTGDTIIRLWKYWDTVRRDNLYPILGTHTANLCNRFADSIVILDVKKSPDDPLLSYVGQQFRDDAQRAGPFAPDPVGAPVSEVPETALLAKLISQYPEVVADGSPVASTIESDDLTQVLNAILLPFSTDGTKLDAILGIGVPEEKFGGETSFEDDAAAPAPGPIERAGAKAGVLAETDVFVEPDILAGADDSVALGSNTLAASLEECRALARAFDAANSRSKDTLYQALQKAYAFSFQAEAEPEAFADLCNASEISMQKRAPFTPVLKLVFGADYDKSRLSDYAACLSYAKRLGQPAETFALFVGTHEEGIKGCAKAERAAARAGRSKDSWTLERALDHFRAATAIGRIEAGAADGDEFCLILGRRAADDPARVDAVQVLDETPRSLQTIILRAARKTAKA